MESEAKKLVNEVKAMKDGDKILNNLDKLKNWRRRHRKALIATLGQRGAELAERAASDVQKGDVSSAAELLSFLNSTKRAGLLWRR